MARNARSPTSGALVLKRTDPARYEQIGRMIDEGFPEGADGPMHGGEVAGAAVC